MLRTRQLLLALVIAAIAAAPAGAQTTEPRGISVEGSASRQVPNDTARFTASVVAEGRTASGALSASARATRRILSAQRALGVARADLRTGSVSVRKIFKWNRRTRQWRAVGYAASNRVRVTIRDLTKAGQAIDAAVAAGATAISSLTLFPGDTAAVYREVLGEAFDDARAKAELLAARAGLTLGRAVFIDEGGQEFYAEEGALAVGESDSPRRRAPTPVRPGTSRVEAFVSVFFETS